MRLMRPALARDAHALFANIVTGLTAGLKKSGAPEPDVYADIIVARLTHSQGAHSVLPHPQSLPLRPTLYLPRLRLTSPF